MESTGKENTTIYVSPIPPSENYNKTPGSFREICLRARTWLVLQLKKIKIRADELVGL
jgi:hypothetical protein